MLADRSKRAARMRVRLRVGMGAIRRGIPAAIAMASIDAGTITGNVRYPIPGYAVWPIARTVWRPVACEAYRSEPTKPGEPGNPGNRQS